MSKQNRSKGNQKTTGQVSTASLLEKEKEYMLLNEELEAQTAKLVKEAEVVMKEQETFLKEVSSPLSYSHEFQLAPCKSNLNETDIVDVISHDTDLLSIAAGGLDDNSDDDFSFSQSNKVGNSHLFQKSESGASKPTSHKYSASKRSQSTDGRRSAHSSKSNEKQKTSEPKIQLEEDSVVLDAAAEMGSEAQIRFLKANLRVLQEELLNVTKHNQSATEECRKYKMDLKEAREENERTKKNFSHQQAQIQKLKTALEDEKKKTDGRTLQLQNVTKELDALKREQKLSVTSYNATEVRLNRANEEIEKLKSQLSTQKNVDKEAINRDQKEIEKLRMDNKRLERLRSDTMTVMKKQQKLIGILKRQILHIEAAKLLSFTEEEFVKALDWGSK